MINFFGANVQFSLLVFSLSVPLCVSYPQKKERNFFIILYHQVDNNFFGNGFSCAFQGVSGLNLLPTQTQVTQV